MTKAQYWVESEINPEYLETGHECDYYGIYHVVLKEKRKRKKILETYRGGHGRETAYTRCRELNKSV